MPTGGEGTRHHLWLGLEVVDAALYARYRVEMALLLAAYGGAFEHDFEISRVLRSRESARINRVFALSFPDRAAREGFLADERYRRVRAALYEPAVARSAVLAAFDAPDGPASGPRPARRTEAGFD